VVVLVVVLLVEVVLVEVVLVVLVEVAGGTDVVEVGAVAVVLGTAVAAAVAGAAVVLRGAEADELAHAVRNRQPTMVAAPVRRRDCCRSRIRTSVADPVRTGVAPHEEAPSPPDHWSYDHGPMVARLPRCHSERNEAGSDTKWITS
jgi:hypothetical protein